MRTNGERDLLQRLGPHLQVVFDVGANKGDWTHQVLQASTTATVHAFELVPATAASLRRRFAGDQRVVVCEFGLLDKQGEVPVKVYEGTGRRSSTNDFPHTDVAHEWHTAPVTTGDLYAKQAGVGSIDLLKIDAEGADHRVLAGFEGMLAGQHIEVVQFDYGLGAIMTKFMLRDFYALLERHGYIVGKLYPDGVEFIPYNIYADEDFLGPNYVAVKRDSRWAELIGALRAVRLGG